MSASRQAKQRARRKHAIVEFACNVFGIEDADHIATLFLSQIRSTPDRPHPILAGFAAAVASTAGGLA